MSDSQLIIALMLAAGTVLFCVSAVESAIFALREHRIPTVAGDRAELAAKLRLILSQKEARLGQVLVLSALFNVGMATLGLLLVRVADLSLTIGITIFLGIIIVCHLLPNVIANLHSRWIFTAISPFVIALATVVTPFEKSLQAVARWMTSLFLPSSLQPNVSLQEDELETLVEMRRHEGALENLEGEVIHQILKLGDKTAKDCMTPRVDLITLALRSPLDEVRRKISEQEHRRIPVYDGKPDEIIGVLDAIAFLQSGDADFRKFVRPPTFVPETLGAITLFHRHLSGDQHMVIVLDEFGGFEGIVTKSDVIDHLVGDAAPTEDLEIQDLGRGRFLLSGSARLDDLWEATGVDLETDGLDTIGGLIMTHLGRTPMPGESVKIDRFTATIRKSTNKRIEELLLALDECHPESGGKDT